jgi:hypothetical protein
VPDYGLPEQWQMPAPEMIAAFKFTELGADGVEIHISANTGTWNHTFN